MSTQTLSDKTLEKVSVITDIDKAKYLLDGSHLEPEHFDHLYDLSLGQLVSMLDDLQMVIGIKNAIRNAFR